MKDDAQFSVGTDVSAVVLAGGASTRMGRDKAWLDFEGEPMIVRAINTLRSTGIQNIFISGRKGSDYSQLNCPVLIDLKSGVGPLGGIERALHEITTALLLVLAVDLPFMSAKFLKKLIRQCTPLEGVVPKLNHHLEPLASIYPKYCQAFAVDAIARSQYAVREFAETCAMYRAVRIYQASSTDARCFANCNTPADMNNGRRKA